MIEDKRTGSPVGSVGCSYYEDLGKVGITYFIGADFRNNGYASEAVKAYVCYFFEHYDENEMIATIREDNLPSLFFASTFCRLLQKLFVGDCNYIL